MAHRGAFFVQKPLVKQCNSDCPERVESPEQLMWPMSTGGLGVTVARPHVSGQHWSALPWTGMSSMDSHIPVTMRSFSGQALHFVCCLDNPEEKT